MLKKEVSDLMITNDSMGEIIYRFLAETANDDECSQLMEWLNKSRENRLQYFVIKRIWQENKDLSDNKKCLDESWGRLKLRTTVQTAKDANSPVGPVINIWKLSVAVTILFILGISSILGVRLKSISNFDNNNYQISVPLGARTNILLPDGTNVWLNAGSSLSYKSGFGRGERHVSLSGEAFFDVNPDNKNLFIVSTRDMEIRVHGTQFNVKSYDNEDFTETTLISGKVEVLLNRPGSRAQLVTLLPNQTVTYSGSSGSFSADPGRETETSEIIAGAVDVSSISDKQAIVLKSVANTEDLISWRDGKLTFRGEKLSTLAPKLERFYNINISFEDDSIKDLKYTGTLEDISLEEMLRAIAKASKINFLINKNHVIFSN